MRDGTAVLVLCRVWDGRRDLALLKVIAIEVSTTLDIMPQFPYLEIHKGIPRKGEKIFCIGQPGSEDLESKTRKRVEYNLFEISEGKYWGIAPGQNEQDNEEIGGLMHDCWTYWGHSGAPLVKSKEGTLIGLHSSWDEETGMRRGIPGLAVREFLRENRGVVDFDVGVENGSLSGNGKGSRDDPVVL
jgi:hypothetical protein